MNIMALSLRHVSFECDHCGKLVIRVKWRLTRHGSHFCSKSCHRKSVSNATRGRFLKLTELKTSGCIHWLGFLDRDGYGILRVDGVRRRAHRHAWILHHGSIPDGMQVLHKCDNPQCVNIEHLFVGTAAENMRDMSEKGRRAGKQFRGESHPRSKVTDAQAIQIANRHIRRRSGKRSNTMSLAREFGISATQVRRISRYERGTSQG